MPLDLLPDTPTLVGYSMMPTGYSLPLPHLSDGKWSEWLDLRTALATAAGISRKHSQLSRVQDIKPRHFDGPLLDYSAAEASIRYSEEDQRRLMFASTIVVRDIRDPYSELELIGMEVDIAHYRKLQLQRLALEAPRNYVQGHRIEKPRGTVLPVSGLERFRTMTHEPYFEDRTAAIVYVGQSASKWNDYRLGKAIQTKGE